MTLLGGAARLREARTHEHSRGGFVRLIGAQTTLATVPRSSHDNLDRPLPSTLAAYVDQLPEPLVEPESSLPVWALKLVEHYFEGADLAAVPGTERGTAFAPVGERPVVNVAFEGVVLQFDPGLGRSGVQTFVANDAPGRPAGSAAGARLGCVLVFHEDADGPHAVFDFDGVDAGAVGDLTAEPLMAAADGTSLFAVDDRGVRAAAGLAERIAASPSRCRGMLTFVGRDGA